MAAAPAKLKAGICVSLALDLQDDAREESAEALFQEWKSRSAPRICQYALDLHWRRLQLLTLTFRGSYL
jgi:hypothetical protein